jgi:hypothetical protein
MGLVFPFSFLQPQGEAPPPSDNFSYTLCSNPEVTLVSTVQLHDDGALALWYNCQWYSIGEIVEAPPTVPAPLLSQVFSSLAPCEEAEELFNYLRWRKCGSEDEFIYTICCELPEGEVYTAGVTTTNNFALEEPSADCYTFEAPSELPEGVIEAGCPEFVVQLSCDEEPCNEEPVITPQFTIDEITQNGNSDFESASPELPPPFTNGTEEQVWIAFQYSEEGEELEFQPTFTTDGFIVGDPQYIVIDENGQINFPAFGIVNFELLEPGKVYQINFTSNTVLNSSAVEGLEGLITFYE